VPKVTTDAPHGLRPRSVGRTLLGAFGAPELAVHVLLRPERAPVLWSVGISALLNVDGRRRTGVNGACLSDRSIGRARPAVVRAFCNDGIACGSCLVEARGRAVAE